FTWVDGVAPRLSCRKQEPLSAAANRPALSLTAPVKEPFTWPNNSLSSSDSGSAPQLIDANVFSERADSEWMYRATTAFPVPDSPWMSTVESVGATVSATRSTSVQAR